MNRPLFSTDDLTLGDAISVIMKFFVSEGLKKQSLARLVTLLNMLFPKPNNFPTTLYKFLKYLYSILLPHAEIINKHQVCEDCLHYLGNVTRSKHKLVYEQCQGNKTHGYFLEYNIKQVLKDAFE